MYKRQRVLTLVNDERDTVQRELAEVLRGLLPAERNSFERDRAEFAA